MTARCLAKKLAAGGAAKKIILRASNPLSWSGTSAVKNPCLQPLLAGFAQVTARRKCPVESDLDWRLQGVARGLSNGAVAAISSRVSHRSGRAPCRLGLPLINSPARLAGPWWGEGSARLRPRVARARALALSAFAARDTFEVEAGEGHSLAVATHDPLPERRTGRGAIALRAT